MIIFDKDNQRQLCTDLACERMQADTGIEGVDYKKESCCVGIWERIRISSLKGAKSIGRPMGIYDTLQLERMDLIDGEGIEAASYEIAKELKHLFNETCITPKRLIVVGLGNQMLSPDAIGSLCAKGVRPTMHIKSMDESFFYTLECSEIAVISPGVISSTGIEAATQILCLCDKIKPNAVLAIDALASLSPERLGTTVQLSNTGIIPGGGLGNHRLPLNEKTLGAPVISIGVPTVINSSAFCPENSTEIGKNNTTKLKQGMFVSPKETDEIVSAAAKIISGGINRAFGIF